MLDEEGKKRVFDQVLNIWAKPEIERRIKDGQMKKDDEVMRVQVICTPGSPNEIKLNDEVIIIAEAKANRNIVRGEEIRKSDVSEMKKFIVDCPVNSGHITLFRFLDKWIVIFDFKYNKENIRRTLEASRSFYESAKDDLVAERIVPFLENCWSSAELSSICHMLSMGRKNESHGKNVENFIAWSELGNVDKRHAKILSKLKDLRGLRYELSPKPIDENFQEVLGIVEEMIKNSEKLTYDL